MKLSRLGEFGLIERVRRTTAQGRGVNLGIGDDAAWVQTRSGSCLLTADLLIEGVHFDLKWTSLYALGYKTLAVNMSDIAAMGGTPAYLLLSLGIPATFESEDVEEFYRGIRSLALKSGVALGGRRYQRSEVFVYLSLLGRRCAVSSDHAWRRTSRGRHLCHRHTRRLGSGVEAAQTKVAQAHTTRGKVSSIATSFSDCQGPSWSYIGERETRARHDRCQ